MSSFSKCLNEWNVIIEALGQGKQSILIRKYVTRLNKFLLYPTVTYTRQRGYLNSFKNEYKSFAEVYSLPKMDDEKFEVKYFAKVENVIKIPCNELDNLVDYHIWAQKHVKSYIYRNSAYIWLLRVYKLKKPVMAERTGGFRYANLLEGVSLDGIEPVINDNNFAKIVEEIENKR